LVTALCASLLAGCGDTEEKDASLLDGNQLNGSGINDASTSGLNNGSGLNGSEMGGSLYGGRGAGNLGPEFSDPNNPLSKRTIYFMLDSSDVLPDFVPIVNAHSQYLIANPSQHVVLEGNSDERGSREYNIALGEKRAKSVASMMKMQGVSESQLSVVSYGEENRLYRATTNPPGSATVALKSATKANNR